MPTRTAVPDIAAPTLDGPSLSLATLTGHVVVVSVWASWCTECRSETATLTSTARATRASGVRFVGIDEADEASKARSYVTDHAIGYPNLQDPDGTLLAKLTWLPPDAIPSTLVIDSHGRAAARIIGAVHSAELGRAIAAARSG